LKINCGKTTQCIHHVCKRKPNQHHISIAISQVLPLYSPLDDFMLSVVERLDLAEAVRVETNTMDGNLPQESAAR